MNEAPGAAPDEGPGAGVVAALYGGFLLTGAATVVLGPLIPHLHAQTGVSHATLAWLFLVQFSGHSAGAMASSFDVRRSLTVGYPMIAIGLLGLLAGWPGALASIAVMGLGLGLVIPATNVFVARRHPDRRAAALSRLNVVWMVGAIASPLLFAGLESLGLARLGPVALAVPLLVVAAVLPGHLPRTLEVPTVAGAGAPSLLLLALFAIQMFLYAGAEQSFGAWIISVVGARAAGGSAIPELMGATFYGALLLGRLAAPAVLSLLGERRVYGFALIAAALSCAVVLTTERLPWLWAGTAAAGLSLAPIFPILAAALVEYTHRIRPAAAGPVFAVCGFGAGALPWLAGQVSRGAGDVRAALWIPAAAIVLLILLLAAGGWARREIGIDQ